MTLLAVLALPAAAGTQRRAAAQERAGPRVVDRVAAVVNGEVVTLGQLERQLRLQQAPEILTGGTCRSPARDTVLPGDEEPTSSRQLGLQAPETSDSEANSQASASPSADTRRLRVLESLVDRLLVLQHVRRFPQPGVTAERVDEEMATLVGCFASPEAFQQELDRWGLSRGGVRRDVEEQLMVAAYVQGRFGSIVDIDDDEIRAYYQETLVPEMDRRRAAVPQLETVAPRIRQILEQQEINERQEAWIDDLRARAEISLYVW